ncbi:MAG: tRNA preQ1(34) S-adenosylmethionine ribosyltransferase-isomerase QueA [Acetomicrobium sp.]
MTILELSCENFIEHTFKEWSITVDLFDISAYDYELHEGFIAQHPVEPRDQSRLMVVEKSTGKLEHRRFYEILDYLKRGDVLVLNDTKVIPARLLGRKDRTGGKAEVLLVKPLDAGWEYWEAMVRPGRRLKTGDKIVIDSESLVLVLDRLAQGMRKVQIIGRDLPHNIIKKKGQVPLPPYINENDVALKSYQTVYARINGSIAAPTAGFHFTEELLKRLASAGIELAYVTLHVGPGTFRPVKAKDIRKHDMHREDYHLSPETAELINRAREEGRRVIAVGTTVVRCLESSATKKGLVTPGRGSTELFIFPGYKFKIIDGMVTNFHLPKSTLLMLVSAFAGYELIMRAYREAIKERYRFYSFGDAMLII